MKRKGSFKKLMDNAVQGALSLLFALANVANKLAELNVGHKPDHICKILKAVKWD